MDPLPNVNKAYYIVQKVERQTQVTNNVTEPTGFFANHNNNYEGSYAGKKDFRKSNGDVKKYCNHCNQSGHVFEQCFERIGYPDWYKGKKGKKGPRMFA